ncbi:MAG: polyribonucleotide nucleotidyltransferase [Candidatus Dependentiae bacterium]|nr:polyribonucleotide nucleotidyltransferase [Candidatus Dependentiae bacterium]
MSKTFKLPEAGLEVVVGKFAGQADGAAWMKCGDNVVLATAVMGKEEREFMGFLPLTVEYREKTSAAGRIPGGYIKREGRLSDTEVLTSRVIDRTIRPLFPADFFSEIQLMATVYSADGHYPLSVMSIIGASIALGLSQMPFLGPIGAVLVGRIDGKLVFNLGLEQDATSDTHILIAGNRDGICMVEGNCELLSEAEMVDLFLAAHEEIKKQVVWQDSIIAECGKKKIDTTAKFDWHHHQAQVDAWVAGNQVAQSMFAPSKQESSAQLKAKKVAFHDAFSKHPEDHGVSTAVLNYMFETAMKEQLPDLIIAKGHRFDGRGMEDVRAISSEVSLLPQVHGSSLFQRGQTQAIACVTLGTAQDAQKVERLVEGVQERPFMLHYNFPPFSVGEARPVRSVGRREVGHGYLAENSFLKVIPTQTDFPYTIRAVVDILECNGSSSMATVCSTTLALMDAGVPLKEMVAGIAMGLVKDSSDNYHVLTDLLGSEDALGLMDFKVTGSDKGIRAIQMDIKAKKGLSRELLQTALERAKTAREYILDEMRKTLSAPRSEISDKAPKVTQLNIPVDKIGVVIGPSGKVIKEIIAQTDTQIDIEDDGSVRIYAKDSSAARRAEQWIRVLVGDIQDGAVFNGVIKRFAEFGLFVELVPGKDGLLHVSSIAKDKQKNLTQLYRVNDVLRVRVVSSDPETGRIKLFAPDLAPTNEK